MESSNINPVALLVLITLCGLVLRARRQVAVKAVLAIAAFIPLGQQLVVAGLHFTFLRILILVGFCRMLSGESKGFQWTTMDKLFLGWALTALVCGMIRSPSAEVFGMFYNSVGIYFLIRCLTPDATDVVEHLQFLSLIAIFIAGVMCFELLTHRNPFYVLGGVPQFVGERDGRFRCQGPFRHPILAGTFAATLFPLLVGLWMQRGRQRGVVLAGIISCCISTVAAASSGALLTCLTAGVGIGMWFMRYKMRVVRWAIIIFIAILTVSMEPPPWYIISKLSDVLGGTGWHRSYLIDQAVKYFNEWWLIGTSVTAHWAPAGEVLAVDPNNMDITNHYVAQGIQGGALRLGLFIAMIVVSFKAVGRALRIEEDGSDISKLWWALGVGLACHCTAFISISYFDQIEVFYFWLLAIMAALGLRNQEALATEPSTGEAQDFSEAQASTMDSNSA